MIKRITLSIFSFICLGGQTQSILKFIKKDQHWSFYEVHDAAHKDLNYIVSKPTKQEGSYDRRGQIWFFVFKRQHSNPQIMIDLGYQTVPNQPYAAVFENEKKYMLIPKGTKIYLEQKNTDSFCDEMKKNKSIQIFGVSSKQNKTTDTYNLAGFSSVFQRLLKY